MKYVYILKSTGSIASNAELRTRLHLLPDTDIQPSHYPRCNKHGHRADHNRHGLAQSGEEWVVVRHLSVSQSEDISNSLIPERDATGRVGEGESRLEGWRRGESVRLDRYLWTRR